MFCQEHIGEVGRLVGVEFQSLGKKSAFLKDMGGYLNVRAGQEENDVGVGLKSLPDAGEIGGIVIDGLGRACMVSNLWVPGLIDCCRLGHIQDRPGSVSAFRSYSD